MKTCRRCEYIERYYVGSETCESVRHVGFMCCLHNINISNYQINKYGCKDWEENRSRISAEALIKLKIEFKEVK